MTQKGTTLKASMRPWFSVINGLIKTKKHVHVLNCHFPFYLLRWLSCNKMRTIEMVQFLLKYGKSDQTKQQYDLRQCCDEGNWSRPGVAMVFAMIEVIQQCQQKSSWCGGITVVVWCNFLGDWYNLVCFEWWMDAWCNVSVLQLN